MSPPNQPTKKLLLLLPFVALVFGLSSCENFRNDLKRSDLLDAQAGLTRAEVKNMMIKDLVEEKKKKQKLEAQKSESPTLSSIPSVSKLVVSPPPPAIGGDKIVTFSVTDQVPLKDVLIELGRVANIDIDIDSSITGGVVINAKNRPFKEVLDRIASMAHLRYSYKNGVLFFERDAPYMKNYFVDYLSGGSVWSDVESNLKSVLAAAESNDSSESGATSSSASVTSNKSAGIISILASERQHIAAQKYLSEVEKQSSAQVLIEAKVIQITLKDNYKTGIDWGFFGNFPNGKSGQVSQSGTNITDGIISIPTGSILTGIFGKSVSGTLNAMEEFGATKALSSPRVHAINNQKSSISFTTKNVYFNVTNTQTGTTQSTNVVKTATSTKVEQETGISLEITPSINLKTNEITMEIKPELSSVTDTVEDPVNVGNKVPVVSSKKLETQVKIQSGNVIVIGGLMEQNNSNQDRGVPWIQRIPFFGWFFKSVNKTSTVTETVIFIKATIINSNSAPNKVDRELQDKLDANKRQFITQ